MFAIVVQVVPPFVEDSHRLTLPELPLKARCTSPEKQITLVLRGGVDGKGDMLTVPPIKGASIITVDVIELPIQPLAVGMMVNVTDIAGPVGYVRVPLMAPLPLAAIPVTVPVLSLVQLNMVEATVLERVIGVIEVPEHIDCVAGVAVTTGVGLMVMVVVPLCVCEQAVVLES